jgi:hypothetical protein
MKRNFRILYLLLPVLAIMGFASCKKDVAGGKGAPTVTRVRYLSKSDTIKDVVHRVNLDSSQVYDDHRIVPFDSTATEGRLGTQYAILGTNLLTATSVSFNGVAVYFNPALVTDNSIIVSIPSNTSTVQVPFGPTQSNKITVVTKYGKVDFNFSIAQPPAVISSFSPLFGGEGDIVTITGTIFNSVSGVKFDDIPAQIVGTPTPTSIQVKVPAGVASAHIFVTTPGGTAKSAASFGFKYTVYDDVLATGWGGQGSGGYDGYNSVRNYKDATHPKRGTADISVQYTNAYGALQLGYGGATVLDVKKLGFTSLKFSVYGGAGVAAGARLQVVINGSYGTASLVTITPGAYSDFTIPLSSLGNPATISEIVIQSYGGTDTIYVDDIGFI